MTDLLTLHKERTKLAAAEARAKEKAEIAAAATAAKEEEILTLLREQREKGLAATAKMKDGTTYTEADRKPWAPAGGGFEEKVKAELIRLELTEFLGRTKYGELKSEFGSPSELPGKLSDLVMQGHAYYLSVTGGKKK